MKRCCTVFAFLGLALPALLIVALLIAQRVLDPTQNIVTEKGVVFGTGGGEPLKLDLTRPKHGDGPFPAVVFVHGGGWVGGTRADFAPMMTYLTSKGIVCISLDYRLAPKHKWPAQIEDVKCGVRWLRANAKNYHVDPNRIAALGGSAGAHLTALLGTTADKKQFEGTGGNSEQSSAICAMICLSGPYDLEIAYKHSYTQHQPEGQSVRGMLGAFLGDTLEKKGKAYREASPITYVSKSTVPALLTHGTADPLVPIEQTEDFYSALKKQGVDVEFMRIEGAGHADFGKKPQEVVDRLNSFLDKHLLKSK